MWQDFLLSRRTPNALLPWPSSYALRASGGIMGASGTWAAYFPGSLCQGCNIIPLLFTLRMRRENLATPQRKNCAQNMREICNFVRIASVRWNPPILLPTCKSWLSLHCLWWVPHRIYFTKILRTSCYFKVIRCKVQPPTACLNMRKFAWLICLHWFNQ